jgi:hypothetical protein
MEKDHASGMARTAVIAGTATAVSNRVSRRQANRWAAQDQQAYEQHAYQQQAYAEPQPALTDDMDTPSWPNSRSSAS